MSDTTPTKEHLREIGVGTDPTLEAEEKETTLTLPNDTDNGRIFSENPTVMKWILSVEEAEITNYRLYSDDGVERVVAIHATIPKGILKFQKSARKSDTHGDMVSYGPLD
jgi:hypothetical protein